MKVCVIGTRGFPQIEGGVEKHCESLYPLLDNDIKVMVYRRKAYVKSDKKYGRITFCDFPSTTIKGVETLVHSFLSTMNALIKKPDVVHFHNIGPALFSPILKLRKIPIVLTYHSPNYEHKKWGYFARKLLLFSESVALKTANKIVFVNRFQMDKYDEKIKVKSVYVPNGINDLQVSNNTDFLVEKGLEKGKYILSVGRITQEKGFDTLIKAYKIAQKDGFKLVIAGGVEFENAYMKELQEMSQNEDVIFTGYVYGEKLAQLYTHTALYVLASNNEGFPLVLLEAMKYGLDVLVSDIPATHLVNLNEDDYFERGNYEVLGYKISTRLQNPKRRQYELNEYDWKEVAKTMSNIFHEVAEV